MTDAQNVIPIVDGFGPLKGLSVDSDALTARARGAVAAADSSGNIYVYAGDATKLYQLVNEVFSDVSKSGGYSGSAASDAQWEFLPFSSSYLLATNYDDPIQNTAPAAGGTFADLIDGTNKPKARHLAAIGDFVILGNTNDTTDGVKPARVWWSGLADPTDFDPAAATQSDYQDLAEGGEVQRIIGGRKRGLVIQDSIIRLMPYVGSPLVFDLSYVIDRDRGTLIPGSVVALGGLVFFISDEGFMLFTEASGSVPIGHGLVDKYFWDNFDMVYRSRVTAAIDPLNKCVFWSYPDTTASGGSPNRLLIYNWATKEWARATVNTEMVFTTRKQGYTLDSLDSLSTDIDSLTFSLDSRAYTAGGLTIAAFDTDHKFNFFTGSNLAATLDTGDIQPFMEGQSMVNEVRPLVDGGASSTTVKVASRLRLQDTVTFGSSHSLSADGAATPIVTSRYHRFRTEIAAAATWTHAQGVQIKATAQGG